MKDFEKDSIIFGIHPINEAFSSDNEIDKILIQQGLKSTALQEIINEAKKRNIYFQFVPIEKLNRITRKNHQGVIAMISMVEYQPLENILPLIYESGKTPFVLILDKITDIRNIGAIARTAECTGIQAIIVPAQNSAKINAEAVKSSAGAILRVPIARSFNLKEDIKFLKESGLQIIGVSEKVDNDYSNNNYTIPTAIIMGSEESGISEEYLKLCDNYAKIPMVGEIGSLNVSVATGIILYEALKQKLQII